MRRILMGIALLSVILASGCILQKEKQCNEFREYCLNNKFTERECDGEYKKCLAGKEFSMPKTLAVTEPAVVTINLTDEPDILNNFSYINHSNST